ncbi:IS2 transposase TnpB [Cedecea davisae]|nr:IS2 transposase TnpB [Cedecea davisae]
MDCACALIVQGRRIADVCRSIGVSHAHLSIRIHRQSDWQNRRRQSSFNDTTVLSRINTAVADLPTYGYRRIWALLRRESEKDGLSVVNAKRVYRIMRTHHLLLEHKSADNHRKRAHKRRVAVAESNRKREKASGYIGSNPPCTLKILPLKRQCQHTVCANDYYL